MNSPYIYGIDFGTTNSTLAILDTRTNEVVKLFTAPSLLFFPESENGKAPYFVGDEAINQYLSSGMKGRFMKSVKRILPNKMFKDTQIGAKRFTAEMLVSLIIRHLKSMADDFLGETIRTAVIGRPVVFDENPEKDAIAQQRLNEAAKLAGLETVYFQMEPIGAAFTYERNLKKSELVLVADFGGGTSDFTLMRLNPNAVGQADRKNDLIGKGGIYLGGDNFDSAIMWEKGTPHFGRGVTYQSQPGKWLPIPITFFHNICYWDKMNFFNSVKIKREVRNYYHFSGKQKTVENLIALIEGNFGFAVFKEIEKAKIALTRSESTLFSFRKSTIDFEETITLKAFSEQIIKKDTDKIEDYLTRFLSDFGVSPLSVDSVFMTGGTSQVKPLKDRFANQFGAEKLQSGDNFNSVAIGLAYSYILFTGN